MTFHVDYWFSIDIDLYNISNITCIVYCRLSYALPKKLRDEMINAQKDRFINLAAEPAAPEPAAEPDAIDEVEEEQKEEPGRKRKRGEDAEEPKKRRL